jgi:Pin2-interacting protein X1
LREDYLGLGAQRGKAEGETFGLEVLSGLLGRLNGKSDGQLKKEEHARRDVKLMTYIGQDGRRMGFVSGGFLVGDKIEKSSEALKESSEASSNSERPSKKRKRSGAVVETSKKQKKRALKKVEDDLGSEVGAEEVLTRGQKKERRARKEAQRVIKEEKRARKEARRLKRETKSEPELHDEIPDSTDSLDVQTPNTQPDSESGQSGTLMPPTPPSIIRGRNVVRQRYIQQKRMACMDQQALNEVS